MVSRVIKHSKNFELRMIAEKTANKSALFEM